MQVKCLMGIVTADEHVDVADRTCLDMEDVIHKDTSQLGPNSICHQLDLPLHHWHGIRFSTEDTCTLVLQQNFAGSTEDSTHTVSQSMFVWHGDMQCTSGGWHDSSFQQHDELTHS